MCARRMDEKIGKRRLKREGQIKPTDAGLAVWKAISKDASAHQAKQKGRGQMVAGLALLRPNRDRIIGGKKKREANAYL